ncbi:MAG: hypothetical protein QOH89_2475 [Pseudonocardiales bacterium]|nr:hypothetical protein [Pseudonocardiales bacterium]
MKRYGIATAVTALVAALTLTGSPSSAARTVPSIAGTWHGTYSSTRFNNTAGHWTAHFHQNGSHVTGTITINPGCITQGSINGTISGSSISFGQVHNGSRTISFAGTITAGGTRMHGTYHSPALCGSDHGTWRGHHA